MAAGENICRLSLEAQQGQVGQTTSLGRIEANGRTWLPTVDSQHSGIQIEDRSLSRLKTARHFLSPLVVKCNEFVPPQEAEALEKATERCRCGAAGKPRQVLKDPIATQRLGGLDPPQAKDKRIQQRLDRFADGVLVIPLSKTNPSLQLVPKAKPLEESMEQAMLPNAVSPEP